jgi:ABC-type dipeptide/oligopeptide/nickel transport system permease component
MLRYTVRRIAGIVPTLAVIVTASFFIVRLAPGGPFDLEHPLPPQVRANLDRAYGFDQPLAQQYLRYVGHLLQGDFGPSLKQRDFSVAELFRHVLRPALLPVVSYLGPAVAFVITGSLVVETVFGLPGTGRYLVQGAINRDYTLIMGMIIVYGVLTLVLNLVADLLYGWLDPRVRHD